MPIKITSVDYSDVPINEKARVKLRVDQLKEYLREALPKRECLEYNNTLAIKATFTGPFHITDYDVCNEEYFKEIIRSSRGLLEGVYQK